ncbi:choice-of-anchor tandem repeat GloVer-containing protein [Rudaea sp.]|uniref:choice-of-anchor tandem repeat GloVer-containing protein n=1 Tax=Rudaea sp. TaxID=2136325 RepID=UPI002ED59CF7
MKPVYRAVALILALTGFAWVCPCTAANTTTIYEFNGGDDGVWPYGSLLEYKGEFYGTTWKGGTSNLGTIFKLTPPAAGHNLWTKTVLHNFTGNINSYTDGAYPQAGLIYDANDGKFYGTTNQGGQSGYGTIFALVPPANPQGEWREATIYSFCSLPSCEDGTYPQASLVLGADGALYGTTSKGGPYYGGYGTAFRLKYGEDKLFRVIYNFCTVGYYCLDGYRPVAELIADKQGALYGTTPLGGNGSGNSGIAFKLTPPAAGTGLWTQTVLYNFCSDGDDDGCVDGASPAAALVFDTQGNLYGTTQTGKVYHAGGNRSNSCSGTVFKLTPPGNGATGWTESVIHSFASGLIGCGPVAALIVDSQNNLYGTNSYGGELDARGVGTVFKVGPPHRDGTPRTLTVLTNFLTNIDDPSANLNPVGPVTLYRGALYGTTLYGGHQGGTLECQAGGESGCGSIFQVSLGAGAPKPTGGGKSNEPHGSGDDGVPAPTTD